MVLEGAARAAAARIEPPNGSGWWWRTVRATTRSWRWCVNCPAAAWW